MSQGLRRGWRISRPEQHVERSPAALTALILEPRFAEAVEARRKVEHRLRVGDEGKPLVEVGDILAIMAAKRIKDKWTQKLHYVRDTACHVRVATLRVQLLHEITDDEVKAEGFKSYDQLVDWWLEHRGEGPGRRGGPFVEIPVRVLGLEVVESRRFLAEGRTIPADKRGYVFGPSGAFPGEMEAIDDATLARYVAQNAEGDADRERKRREDWERRTMAARMAELEDLASSSGVDVSRELRLIENTMGKAKAKIDRHERAAA